jgi:hypothetical protein
VNAGEIFSRTPFPNDIDLVRIRAPSMSAAAGTNPSMGLNPKPLKKFSEKVLTVAKMVV